MSIEAHFVLSQSDGRPMYLQIIEQIKHKVMVGDWPHGHKLPSIREFAVALSVSVITVKRAYQELETQGVIVTRQGKGSFVASDEKMNMKIREQELDSHLMAALNKAVSLGISTEALAQRLYELELTLNEDDNGSES